MTQSLIWTHMTVLFFLILICVTSGLLLGLNMSKCSGFFFKIIITLNVVYLWCGDSITHTIFNIHYYKFTAGTVIFCFTSYINPWICNATYVQKRQNTNMKINSKKNLIKVWVTQYCSASSDMWLDFPSLNKKSTFYFVKLVLW